MIKMTSGANGHEFNPRVFIKRAGRLVRGVQKGNGGMRLGRWVIAFIMGITVINVVGYTREAQGLSRGEGERCSLGINGGL